MNFAKTFDEFMECLSSVAGVGLDEGLADAVTIGITPLEPEFAEWMAEGGAERFGYMSTRCSRSSEGVVPYQLAIDRQFGARKFIVKDDADGTEDVDMLAGVDVSEELQKAFFDDMKRLSSEMLAAYAQYEASFEDFRNGEIARHEIRRYVEDEKSIAIYIEFCRHASGGCGRSGSLMAEIFVHAEGENCKNMAWMLVDFIRVLAERNNCWIQTERNATE